MGRSFPFSFMFRFLILLLLSVISLSAQNYVNTRCGSQVTGQIYLVALGQVAYDTCLKIGPTLKVSVVAGVPQLDAIIPVAPAQPKLVSNSYFSLIDMPETNQVQIMPGLFAKRTLEIMSAIPPTTNATCGQGYDGDSHLTYSFGRTGSVIITDTYLYICTDTKKWKRIKLEEIQ